MPNYVFVRDRETQTWHFHKETGFYHVRETVKGPRGGTREVKRIRWNTWITPTPEAVDCFVDKHIIVTANNREEAWQQVRAGYPSVSA